MAQLRELGFTHEAIGEHVGYSRVTVSRTLLARENAERTHEDVQALAAEYRAGQLAQLDYVFAEAMRAWQRSLRPRRRRTVRWRTRTGKRAMRVVSRTVVREQGTGDPAFLAAARAALRDQRALLPHP